MIRPHGRQPSPEAAPITSAKFVTVIRLGGSPTGSLSQSGKYLNPSGPLPAMFVAMAPATRTSANPHSHHDDVGAALNAYTTMLRRYLYVLGADRNRVDDLIQEVFVLVLRKEPEQSDRRAFGAFLRGCAKNMLLRERRSAGACREVELADEVWQQTTECQDARVEALRTCVDALPSRSRKLLESTYEDELSRSAIGQLFGMREDGIKTTLRRLRAGLRECVERRLRGDS